MPERRLLKDGGKIWELGRLLLNDIYNHGGDDKVFEDLLRPDSRVRAQMVAIVMNIAVATGRGTVAISNDAKSEQLRILAVAQLDDDQILECIAMKGSFEKNSVKVAATNKIVDQATLKRIALHEDRDPAEAATKKLTSQNDLLDVALKTNYNSTRFVAVGKLTDEKRWDLLSRIDNEQVMLCCVSDLEDRGMLWSIVGNHKNSKMRDEAKKRLEELG